MKKRRKKKYLLLMIILLIILLLAVYILISLWVSVKIMKSLLKRYVRSARTLFSWMEIC